MGKKVSAEETVKVIRRQTRRQHNTEEKLRVVLGLMVCVVLFLSGPL